jgi:hypothetical protein
MKFLTTADCEDYAKRLGPTKDVLDHRKLGRMKKKFDLGYSSLENAGSVANEIVSCLGDFASALLWTHALVWGDRTTEPNAPQVWADYGRWRAKLGATASLYTCPGQLFEPDERATLAEAIAWTILTGSDAVVLAQPTRVIVHLSHDDLISLHSRSTPNALHELEKLGLRRMR